MTSNRNEVEFQEVKSLLVENISDFPKIKYKDRYFEAQKLVEIVAELFYKSEGTPVSTQRIAKSVGLEKTEKFARVLHRRLVKRKLLKDLYIERKRFFYPWALILKPQKGRVLDLTSLPLFKENFQNISKKVVVNICESSITLHDLLLLLGKDRTEAVQSLVDLAKSTSAGKYNQVVLIDLISRRLLETEVNQKTREARYKLGNLTLDFILWLGTGEKGLEFTCKDITCDYVDKPIELPQELQAVMEKIIKERKQKANECGQTFDNHPSYRLINVTPSRELLLEKKERKLQPHLTFGPTDFYTSVVTNQNIDQPVLVDEQGNSISIRQKYLKNDDLSDSVYLLNSKLANMFGVALATITEDNKILLQRRSRQVFMGPRRISVATAENMIRGMDEDEHGRPNPFITAQRCLKEEIGVQIELTDVAFLGLGIRLDNLLPQALGIINLKLKSSELSFVKARDRWEGSNFTEEFLPDVLRKYFKESYLISDTAKLTILLALINQYGFEHVKEQIIERKESQFEEKV